MERALDLFAREPNGGVIETASVSGTTHRKTIISIATRYRLPTVYPFRYYVIEGGLASYGPDPFDQFKRAAKYIDRILKGASQAIFLSRRLPNTIWSSICRPPRLLASPYRQRCSAPPTK